MSTDTITTSTATTPAGNALQESPEALDHVVRVLNDGAIAVLASIGYQTGLFETMATLPPATSQQVADAAGLNERYVRECLDGLVTGGFVDYDPAERRYAVKPDHLPFLTGAGPDNLARGLQYITLMGQVTPKVIECVRNGGGLRYSDYPDFHDIQAAESGAVMDAALIDTIVPLTGLVDRLREGIDVVDIGCGEGHAVNLLAREFPRSRFTGYDFEGEALVAARAEAQAWGLTNATFVECDVARDVDPGIADLVTAFDTIHDQADPARVLANVRAALRPGGVFLMADMNTSTNVENNVDLPWASFLYAISTTHCMSVSLGQGGAGLGTCWGVELAEQMLREAGFTAIDKTVLDDDPFNAYFVSRV